MIEIIKGTNQKPNASNGLVSFFSQSELEGVLYVGYPLISTPNGKEGIDAIWISKQKGIVLFNLIEGHTAITEEQVEDAQDFSADLLESKLKTDKRLSHKRKLLIPIQTLSYAPAISDILISAVETDYVVVNSNGLETALDGLSDWAERSEEVYTLVLSSLQNISNIRAHSSARNLFNKDSKGSKLKLLEDAIATLDVQQSKAVIETVDGVQRIRGLAGSGKTVILALKAAYIYSQHPNWKIAVTFNTRSLKGQLRKLINNFTISYTGEEPNWDNLRIINAWGGAGGKDRTGMYYQFTASNGLNYLDFGSAARMYGNQSAFNAACSLALREWDDQKLKQSNEQYDLILVDEAQDFPSSFLKMCYLMLNEEKRLVYAYDELQQLSIHSLPSPEEIFGNDVYGNPLVSLEPNSTQDITLSTCYRNSRPVLATAHALGFGIYRTPHKDLGTGIVQIFENKQLWLDVGYEIVSGELELGSDVCLQRTEKSSPSFLEIDTPANLVQFIKFNSKEEQDDWVAKEIINNLQNEELLPEDLIVINPHPFTAKQNLGRIRKILYENSIPSHFAGVDTNPDIFFTNGSITFTGIYRAKGNEAGMVYIVNSDECVSSSNQATLRNRLFTAITRSKAWVRVLGIGDSMQELIEEFSKIVDNKFRLNFQYPTKEQIKTISMIHREKTVSEEREAEEVNATLSTVLTKLGNLSKHDIDSATLEKLKSFLLEDDSINDKS